jgi:hypothetical protein
LASVPRNLSAFLVRCRIPPLYVDLAIGGAANKASGAQVSKCKENSMFFEFMFKKIAVFVHS